MSDINTHDMSLNNIPFPKNVCNNHPLSRNAGNNFQLFKNINFGIEDFLLIGLLILLFSEQEKDFLLIGLVVLILIN